MLSVYAVVLRSSLLVDTVSSNGRPERPPPHVPSISFLLPPAPVLRAWTSRDLPVMSAGHCVLSSTPNTVTAALHTLAVSQESTEGWRSVSSVKGCTKQLQTLLLLLPLHLVKYVSKEMWGNGTCLDMATDGRPCYCSRLTACLNPTSAPNTQSSPDQNNNNNNNNNNNSKYQQQLHFLKTDPTCTSVLPRLKQNKVTQRITAFVSPCALPYL
jgi:hypothetical protein